jgi:hypothetical protein
MAKSEPDRSADLGRILCQLSRLDSGTLEEIMESVENTTSDVKLAMADLLAGLEQRKLRNLGVGDAF